MFVELWIGRIIRNIMKSVELKHSRNEVNRAGAILRDINSSSLEIFSAAGTLSNWRAIHSYPINTFQATLRNKLKGIDDKALVAQRLKRTPSIIGKLRRYNSMKLSRMQDIGGLRAVVNDIHKVQSLYDNYKKTPFQHTLISEYNYIDKPKESGYRSIHLVYRYNNSRIPDYNGLLIELQFRTKKQHAWATAVETVGVFLNHALKSSEGPSEWLEFFSLTSSAFAHIEHQNPVPKYENFTRDETDLAVAKQSKRLKVVEILNGYGFALNTIYADKRRGSYYLLILDPIEKTLQLKSYSKESFDIATKDYLEAEANIVEESQKQAVLVSTASVEALKRAYPNFFLDTHEFLMILKYIEKRAAKL